MMAKSIPWASILRKSTRVPTQPSTVDSGTVQTARVSLILRHHSPKSIRCATERSDEHPPAA